MIHRLENVSDREEAENANLVNKANILKLGFIWSEKREGSSSDEAVEESEGDSNDEAEAVDLENKGNNNSNDEAVLEGLQPHPNLKSLKIENFGGYKLASWMMRNSLPLDNLVKIKLRKCRKCEKISMLGHLPCLMDLEIEDLDNVKCIDHEFYGYDGSGSSSSERRFLFPALIKFKLVSMGSLEQWMEASGVVFPNLDELVLEDCPLLTTAPTHFSSIRYLNIGHVDSSMPVANISSNLTTLTSLCIDSISELTCLPEVILKNNKNLEDLTIENCGELDYIAPDISGCQTSLRSLNITECEKLRYLPDVLHTLVSLEQLEISYCPSLVSIPSIRGVTSLRRLEISNCDALTSLPSGLQSCTSLEDLSIENCPSLEFINPSIHALTSLRRLEISNFNALTSLPIGLQSCTSLEDLSIVNCPSLESIPSIHGLSSPSRIGGFQL